MKLSTILWPWGRMLEQERELAETQHELAKVTRELGREIQKHEDSRGRTRMYREALTSATRELKVLHDKIKQGHFRNPATGRLGPKGVTYDNTLANNAS